MAFNLNFAESLKTAADHSTEHSVHAPGLEVCGGRGARKRACCSDLLQRARLCSKCNPEQGSSPLQGEN